MTKELVISSNRHETKLAVLEDDQLVEIYFQRANEYSLVGSIHKGRVTRVLPGMQSAFVELGLERDAFLYVTDFFEEAGEDYERISAVDDRKGRGEPRAASPAQAAEPAAGAAPAREAGDRDRDRGDRDGRRRRGRRRRHRGGLEGLPESKYASPMASEPLGSRETAREAAREAKPETEAGPEAEEIDALVLPGETIAKYRRPSGEAAWPGAESEEEEDGGEERAPAAAAGDLMAELQQEVQALMARPDERRTEAAEAALTEAAREEALGTEDIAAEVEEEELGPETVSDEAGLDEEAMAEEDTGAAGVRDEASGPGSREAEVREQPTARYIQRGGRRPRRRGGRSGGGERYESVPRADAQAVARPEGGREREGRERRESRERDGRDRERGERPALPSIADLLKEGQEIIVQIAKEPLGQKGARITSHIAMPGRYVVYMPTSDHHGVSRKVGSDEERQRLKRVVQTHSQGMTGGFIVRTAGEGKVEAEIAADMTYLYNQWLDIRKKSEKRPAPCLLHHDLELVTRTLRDQVNEQYKTILIDNQDVYENTVGFLERFQPALVSRVKLYTRDSPVFDVFNVTSELEKALRPKVWLKSGGYIVINQTEALVAIDINTGKFVGKSNRLEDTIVKTNLEAIREIVRQIRLRDLGGIIVVDFIDMEERRNRQKVMQGLEEAMRMDRAPYKILSFNDFGLVAITRRRVKQSLERALCSACPTCEGAGYVKSVQTVIGEILTEAHKIAPALESQDVMLRVHPDVAKTIKAADSHYIQELEEILGRTVLVKSDAMLHPEKFDLA